MMSAPGGAERRDAGGAVDGRRRGAGGAAGRRAGAAGAQPQGRLRAHQGHASEIGARCCGGGFLAANSGGARPPTAAAAATGGPRTGTAGGGHVAIRDTRGHRRGPDTLL